MPLKLGYTPHPAKSLHCRVIPVLLTKSSGSLGARMRTAGSCATVLSMSGVVLLARKSDTIVPQAVSASIRDQIQRRAISLPKVIIRRRRFRGPSARRRANPAPRGRPIRHAEGVAGPASPLCGTDVATAASCLRASAKHRTDSLPSEHVPSTEGAGRSALVCRPAVDQETRIPSQGFRA
jgi:hypothetical protein